MSSKRCLLAIALALTVQCGLQAQTRTTVPAARTKAVASRSVSSRPATASRPVRQTSNVIDETIIEEPYLEAEPMMDDAIGGCCDSGACGHHWWARAEYLSWWTNGSTPPALATTSPTGTAQAAAGVLGQSGTSILFGTENLDSDWRSGGRISIGGWADACHSFGWEANYLQIGEETQGFSGGANQFGILARPFLNAQTGLQDSRLIVFPGLITGSLNIESTTDFQALEVLFRGCWIQNPCGRTDYVFGYRYADLGDSVRIEESTLALSGPTAGTRFEVFDEFSTRNTFHGIEVGIISEQNFCPCWTLELMAKLAVGATRSEGTVGGGRLTTNNLGTAGTPSGLLALSTNDGEHGESRFSVLPELGAKLRYDINPRWKASLGYSIMCWTDVVRAPEQIDGIINPSQIPPSVLSGVARPLFPFAGSDFVAQGLSLGLECSF